MRKHKLDLASVALTDAELAACDCAIIVTDHKAIDYQKIVDQAPLVIDPRNATRSVGTGRENIVKA